jgi:hypothetical protein
MEKITIINPYGTSITFEQGVSGFMLISRGDLGATQSILQTDTGYLQRGTTVTQKRYASKTLNLTLGIKAASDTDMQSRLKRITRLFESEYNEADDLTKFTIIFEKTGFTTKKTYGYLQITPSFLNDNENSRGNYQRSFCSFLLPEPVWFADTEIGENLATKTNLFEFPLDITTDYEFSQISSDGVVVVNSGDIRTSLIIEFDGIATNPKIENVTYGESLKLNTTIVDGDVVTIDTSYNNPRVEINSGGVISNVFEYIDPKNSDLNMTLRRGKNTLLFTSDDTSPAVARVYYTEKYITPFGGSDE